ncbi:MAG: DNA repair protein RecO [Anaerolineae bacterium]|nr:DNA repair protein RecO [Anaerolineae bacterium]
MSSQRIYRTEAIIIRRRNQGEADRILTLCTPMGKLAVIARGARKVRSRKAGHLELFAHVHLVLARSRSSWDVVSQAETVAPHAALRDDLARGTYARYVAELYDHFVAEGEGNPALFDLMVRVMGYLCREEQLPLLVRGYEQRLLAQVGFRPEWEQCVGWEDHADGQPLEATGEQLFGLDPERGGVLCPQCFRTHRERRGVVPLSPAALALLRACQREPFVALRNWPATPQLLREVERAAQHYIAYHLEREVRSGAFLQRLRREGGI